MAIHEPPSTKCTRVKATKSASDAKAREVISANGAAVSCSTRACTARKFGKRKAPATCRTNAAFLPTVSTQVTSSCGAMTASTTPGNPPPLPTSKTRPPVGNCRNSGGKTAKQSNRC